MGNIFSSVLLSRFACNLQITGDAQILKKKIKDELVT